MISINTLRGLIHMIDTHLLTQKLKRIEQFLREMETADGPATFAEFSSNTVFKRFVERNIELSIEQMIDICRHLVSGLDLQEPETYAACFEILGNADIIPETSVETFKAMARYRNLIIHGYDGVEDTITFGILKKRLGDFRIYIGYIRQYLRSTSA